MQRFVWFNPYLPQTLQVSVAIAYFRAGFSLLMLLIPASGFISIISIGVMILGALGAFGIANVRWWGYILGVFVAGLPYILGIFGPFIFDFTMADYFSSYLSFGNAINILIDAALLALLIHPMSWNYVKRNFEKTIP